MWRMPKAIRPTSPSTSLQVPLDFKGEPRGLDLDLNGIWRGFPLKPKGTWKDPEGWFPLISKGMVFAVEWILEWICFEIQGNLRQLWNWFPLKTKGNWRDGEGDVARTASGSEGNLWNHSSNCLQFPFGFKRTPLQTPVKTEGTLDFKGNTLHSSVSFDLNSKTPLQRSPQSSKADNFDFRGDHPHLELQWVVKGN